MKKKLSVFKVVILLLARWSQFSWWEQKAIKAGSWPHLRNTPRWLTKLNIIIFILMNQPPWRVSRNSPTNPSCFSSSVHQLLYLKVLRHWTRGVLVLPVFWNRAIFQSINFFFLIFFNFLSVRPSLSLCLAASHCELLSAAFRGSDAVHLHCSLTCSMESKCLAGRAGKNINKSCALNTQHNSGVHYNCGMLFFWWGERASTRTTKL